jgi:hypothetical protein
MHDPDQPTPQDHHAEATKLLAHAAALNYRGFHATNYISAAQAHLTAAQADPRVIGARATHDELLRVYEQHETLRRIVAQHLTIPCVRDAGLTWALDRLQAEVDKAGICLDPEVLDAQIAAHQADTEDDLTAEPPVDEAALEDVNQLAILRMVLAEHLAAAQTHPAGPVRKVLTEQLVKPLLADAVDQAQQRAGEPEWKPNGGHDEMCAYVAGIGGRCTCRVPQQRDTDNASHDQDGDRD